MKTRSLKPLLVSLPSNRSTCAVTQRGAVQLELLPTSLTSPTGSTGISGRHSLTSTASGTRTRDAYPGACSTSLRQRARSTSASASTGGSSSPARVSTCSAWTLTTEHD